MRTIIWIVLFALGLTGVVIPCIYLYASSGLPRLETEYDLETHLRLSIEGERMSLRRGKLEDDGRDPRFSRPDFSKLPHDLIALYISQLGCPNFFATPREEGPTWAWRTLVGVMGVELDGDGYCERYLAWRLSENLGVGGTLPATVATNKIHTLLQKDELVAYDLESIHFERGVVGVHDAAWALYRRDVKDMQLAELAEFSLALPHNGFYEDIKQCKNASLIKQSRDKLLRMLGGVGLVPADKMNEAMRAPVGCLTVAN